PIVYDLPEMEEYLKDTYGITVYQEQVMLLSQKLAGFSKGQADVLRKAMGKKQRDVLDKMKGQFIEGAIARGHDAPVCEKIWKDWEAFAEYAFNKSHSTCYAYVSYQTAYLKAHHPPEFMAALLSRNFSDIRKISFFMDECKRMGLSVKGPDVNESFLKFSVDSQGNVRFGLVAVKGVGEAAVEHIIKVRREGGKFTSIYDFVERVNLTTVNKKTFENLVLAGAFDSLTTAHRSRFLEPDAKGNVFLDLLTRYGNRVQDESNNSQQSLFGGGGDVADIRKPEPPMVEEWGKLETLGKEKEVVGIYLSSHPLDDYAAIIRNFCNTELAMLSDLPALKGKEFSVAGIVTAVQHLSTRDGKPYGRFTVEDYSDSFQFTLFSKDYEQFRRYCYENYCLLIKGRVGEHPFRPGELEIRILSMAMLSDVQEKTIREMLVTVPVEGITPEFSDEFLRIAEGNKGTATLRVKVYDSVRGVSLGLTSRKHKVRISNELISFLDHKDIKYVFV
ncbi:MAG: DNA polymerase III subunit alpha, partial [Rikenellaceae bacterium]|nr:DNA polymerase III subunit alpha [Rikenellaceae bacterium]